MLHRHHWKETCSLPHGQVHTSQESFHTKSLNFTILFFGPHLVPNLALPPVQVNRSLHNFVGVAEWMFCFKCLYSGSWWFIIEEILWMKVWLDSDFPCASYSFIIPLDFWYLLPILMKGKIFALRSRIYSKIIQSTTLVLHFSTQLITCVRLRQGGGGTVIETSKVVTPKTVVLVG